MLQFNKENLTFSLNVTKKPRKIGVKGLQKTHEARLTSSNGIWKIKRRRSELIFDRAVSDATVLIQDAGR